MSEPLDPWSIDYFNPPNVKTPGAVKPMVPTAPKPPKAVPEQDRLFQIQRNALRALNTFEEIERRLDEVPKGWDHLGQNLENIYRTIRSYLAEYSQ